MNPYHGTIMIVDDQPTGIEVLAAALEDAHDIIFATSGREALRLAHEAKPDLILLDVLMPDMDGYEVCARLKADPMTTDIPVMFVTGLGADADETHGLEVGAIDYVTKPVRPAILRARVRNHLELKRARDQLELMTATDMLTGLTNRRQLTKQLDDEILRNRRYRDPLAVVLCDIDHFKSINDTYGHNVGDAVLVEMARLFRDHVRKVDTAGRWGGEEFLIICPNIELPQAVVVAEKLRDIIAQHHFSGVGKRTCSFGVAALNPAEDLHHFIGRADAALYRAKELGRNRVEIALIG